MNLHEYQAKEILRDYGVPMLPGAVAESAAAAEAAARELGGAAWAVKAQVHAGGRGKAGGVRLVGSTDAVRGAADELIGSCLVTAQTGAQGKVVKRVYVEQGSEIEQELYLAVLVDRSLGRVTFLASREGGEDIEATAAARPERIERLPVDSDAGFDAGPAGDLAAALGLKGGVAESAVAIMEGLYRAFLDKDASLIEINPLAVTKGGALQALDVKMVLDDNALFRHGDLEDLRDDDEVDPTELEAQRYELNYVKLDGDIGVMVNGAGLALATIDMLHDLGGRPADFMDVRPEATRDQIATGFGMLLVNPTVKAILVNIYGGGILRCDTVAEGIAEAYRDQSLTVPLIVRVAGTNREMAEKLLTGQGVPAVFAKNLADATGKVVQALGGEAG